ncbi:TonB family protein [Pantoea sp. SIMBA_072]
MSEIWHSEKKYPVSGLISATILAIGLHAIFIYYYLANNVDKPPVSLPVLPKAAPIVVQVAPQLESVQIVNSSNASASSLSEDSAPPPVAGIDHSLTHINTQSEIKVAKGDLSRQIIDSVPHPDRVKKKQESSRKNPHSLRTQPVKQKPTLSKNNQPKALPVPVIAQSSNNQVKSVMNKAPEIGAESNSAVNALKNWQSVVLAKLQASKKYPAYALRTHMEDTVLVTFRVNASGEVSEPAILKSAGYTLLDNETLSLISRVSPLPKPPETALSNGYTDIVVPIIFTIK